MRDRNVPFFNLFRTCLGQTVDEDDLLVYAMGGRHVFASRRTGRIGRMKPQISISGRCLTYLHLAVAIATCLAFVQASLIGGQAVGAICIISILSVPVFGAISIWLFVQAIEAGDYKKLLLALAEMVLTIIQIGFLIPQVQ
jgi:hypothetical protein